MIFKKHKYKLAPLWSFSQNGNIWKFIISDNDILFGETRDLVEKKLYLFALNIKTGKQYFKNYQFEEGNFWVSIETIDDYNIYLHRFEKPEVPYHKSIICIDIKSNKLLWENSEYKFFAFNNNNIIGYRQKFQEFEFSELDINNGSVRKIFSKEDYDKIIKRESESMKNKYSDNYIYPEIYRKQDTSNSVKHLINKLNINDGNIEFIIFNKYLIFNYYIASRPDNLDKSSKYFKNILCIYNLDNQNMVYQDTINKMSSLYASDNFFIYKNILIYLKGKKEIAAINLSVHQ